MRTSIMGKTLIFSGIVLFGGIVVAEMVALSLSSTPTTREEGEEPPAPSAVIIQPAGESASQSPRTAVPAVKAARVIERVERVKRTFKLLQRSKETSSSTGESKPGS